MHRLLEQMESGLAALAAQRRKALWARAIVTLLILVLIVLTTAGCGEDGQENEDNTGSQAASESSNSTSSSGTSAQAPGDTTSESRDVSGFDEVALKGIGNLSIRQGDNESLNVEAEEDVLPKIKTEVENNRLVVGPERNTRINTTEPINYELTVENLSALEVSGSGDVEAEGLSADGLATTISGSGVVEISGEAGSQDVDVSGSGDYQAENLESKEANVYVAGSGSAVVNVSGELNAEVNGSGSVEYIGNPTVEQDVSGAGEVSQN